MSLLLPVYLQAAPIEFEIAAQPAADALVELAKKADLEVLFSYDNLKNVQSNAVVGTYEPEEALHLLLRDTPFSASGNKAGKFVVAESTDIAPGGSRADSGSVHTQSAPEQSKRRHLMNPKNPLAVLIAWLSLGIVPIESWAQPSQTPAGNAPSQQVGAMVQATGVVTGRVSNQATGAYLEGARIQAAGRSITADRGGAYRLELPPGNYRLGVSYVGLDTERIDVTIVAGEILRRDVALTSEVYALDEFTVAGDREGSALAITLQREAPNVKNVVAVDHFGRPHANPADLLQRLPGVVGDITGSEIRDISIRGIGGDFNSVKIDGNRSADAGSVGGSRSQQFQHLSTSNVENVELIKAPTPDMAADSIGGSVNLVTTSIIDRPPRRTFTYSVGTAYRHWENAMDRNKDKFGLDEFRFRYSDVFSVLGGENNFGITVTANYRKPVVHFDYTYHDYQTNVATPETPRYQWQFSTREFLGNMRRLATSVRFDYRLSDTTRIFVNNQFNNRYEYQTTWRFWWNTPSNGSQVLAGYSYDYTEARTGNVELLSQTIDKHGWDYTFNPGAVHDFGMIKIDYDVFESYSRTRYRPTSDFQVRLTNVGGIIDRRETSPWYPVWTPTGENADRVWDLSNYSLVPNGFQHGLNTGDNTNRGAKLNVRFDLNLPVPTYVKAGLKIDESARTYDRKLNRWQYLGPDLGRFQDRDYVYSHMNGRYPVMPFAGPPERGKDWDIMRVIEQEPEQFSRNVIYNAQQRHIWDRFVRERIDSAYIMGDTTLDRLSVLAGLRVEQTDVKGRGYLQILTPEERARRAAWVGPVTEAEAIRRVDEEYGRRQTSAASYRDVFPGVHFRYRATDKLLARASYSTGIGRPPLNNIIPQDSIDLESQQISRNNPDLKPRYANSFDVSLEYYFEPVGLLSAGAFLKEIHDFISTFRTTIPAGPDNGFDGDYAGFELVQRRNTGSATVRGFELNYQQQFTFLPGWLSGLGIYANYTRLESKGNPATGTPSARPVPNFVPQSGNAGITYRYAGLSTALQATHVGDHLNASAAALSNERWRRARTIVELRTRYSLSRHADVYVDIFNLFNEPVRPMFRGEKFRHVAELNKEGVHFAAGISGRF